MCLQILKSYGIFIHIYMRIWKKCINTNFSISYLTKQQPPTVLRRRGCFVKYELCLQILLSELCLQSLIFLHTYLSIFLVYLDVSNAYKFRLVFHVSQDFSWHMNCVCNSPFVNCVFKSFLLYIYHNLQAYLLFGRNR